MVSFYNDYGKFRLKWHKEIKKKILREREKMTYRRKRICYFSEPSYLLLPPAVGTYLENCKKKSPK